MLNQKQIAQKLKQLRESANLSQEVLAEKIGLSRPALSQLEQGKRGLDTLELAKLASIFRVSIDEFLQDQKNNTKIIHHAKHNSAKFKFNRDKLKNLILYILEKCGGKPNLGETVLYKNFYFCDFDNYEITGQPITGLNYVKLQFGPVPKIKEYTQTIEEMIKDKQLQIIWQEYHGLKQKRYISLADANTNIFKAKEKETIDNVIKLLSDMNATTVENYVHGDAPWKITNHGEIIDYNLVFERTVPYAKTDQNNIIADIAAIDTLKALGEMPPAENNYYQSL